MLILVLALGLEVAAKPPLLFMAFGFGVAKEIIFVLQILESLEIKAELPIIVSVDNVGAIFMSGNKTTTNWAKHINIRTKYASKYCEDKKIKIIFVKSVDNDSDICTKNLGGDLFEKHSMKLDKMYE